MPTRTAIVTNPAHDDATKYLAAWSDKIKLDLLCRSIVFDIFELKHDEVTKDKLMELIDEKNPNLVLFHGHGSNKSIFGFNLNVLIECDNNEDILKDRIVHSLTCNSGEELGPKCILYGTKTYIGYNKEFKFNGDGSQTDTLRLSDILASIFLEPAFEVEKALLEGDNSEQAYNRSQQKYNDNLQILLTSSNPVLNSVYASRLYHDMVHQVVLGDLNSLF